MKGNEPHIGNPAGYSMYVISSGQGLKRRDTAGNDKTDDRIVLAKERVA